MPGAAAIESAKQLIVQKHGDWTAHSIHLGSGVYTFPPCEDPRLRRFLQVAADVVGKPLNQLRVLDLACLEGQFGIEFALHGAQVLSIEGREANLAKARFAGEMLSLNNIQFVQDDVRNLDPARHGQFDVVLCAGILYHLNAPDAMEFLDRVSDVCRGIAIIDTHISLSDQVRAPWKDRDYWGRTAREHHPDAPPEEKTASLWYSLDNTSSFIFTLPSLCNILRHVGFTSVLECLVPYEYSSPTWPVASTEHIVMNDRITLVAVKGQKQAVRSMPLTESIAEIDRPERPRLVSSDPHFNKEYSGGRRSRLRRYLKGVWRALRGQSADSSVLGRAAGSSPAGAQGWPWQNPFWPG